MKITLVQRYNLLQIAGRQAASGCPREEGLRPKFIHRAHFTGGTGIGGLRKFRRDSLCALRTPSESNKKGSSEVSGQQRQSTTRRPSRSWIDELTAEILKAQSDLLASEKDVSPARSEVVAAKDEVIKANNKLALAVKAQAEAERLALDRLRELGMVNARGIIEWAEVRAKNLQPEWERLNRLALWTRIIQSDEELRKCLTNAGWDDGTLSSNMLGLYASLSSDIHKDATPEVSQAIGGIIVSVNDTGSRVNATSGKILVCVARANFIKASLRGKIWQRSRK